MPRWIFWNYALARLNDRPARRTRLALSKVLIPAVRSINATIRTLSSASHRFQYHVEGFLRGSGEWFDHEIDVHWQWQAKQRPMFIERGVINLLAVRPGARILELCSGDGFYSARFYSGRAARVVAIDHNASALRHARQCHARSNVEYRHADIREGLPEGLFDNVIWDAAIHHFTVHEARDILRAIHARLVPGGVVSGYTVIDPNDEYIYARLHFSNPHELAELLQAEFTHVAVIETPDQMRRNLHFFATDEASSLPFAEGVQQLLCARSLDQASAQPPLIPTAPQLPATS